jgi:hypothetical protein
MTLWKRMKFCHLHNMDGNGDCYILREISQVQTDKYYSVTPTVESKIKNDLRESESRIVAARGWERRVRWGEAD